VAAVSPPPAAGPDGIPAYALALEHKLTAYLPPASVARVREAFRLGEAAHAGQTRRSGEPYITHPVAVAGILADLRLDAEAVIAAILHDTILEVTDDKTLDKATRKQRQIEHAPHVSAEAKLVKLADKICNLRDILASPPANWPPERKQAYFDWASQVVAGVRGTHAGLEAVFDGLLARRGELR